MRLFKCIAILAMVVSAIVALIATSEALNYTEGCLISQVNLFLIALICAFLTVSFALIAKILGK